MIKRAIVSGIVSAGAKARDVRELPVPVTQWATLDAECAAGIHVLVSPLDQRSADIRFFDTDGLQIDKRAERKLENLLFREDFRRAGFYEMGDIVRKYIALDGYVAHYLPIRGETVMADTLKHYRPLDAPSWRLILNAIHSLMLRYEPPGAMPAPPAPVQPPEPKVRLTAALDIALRRLPLDDDAPLRTLVGLVRDDLRGRIAELKERLATVEAAFSALDPPAPGIRYLWAGCETAALAAVAAAAKNERPLSERLAAFETALALAEAWCRLGEGERHFGRHQ